MTSTTFLAAIEMMQQAVFTDRYKNYRFLTKFFEFLYRCWVECHSGYNPLSQLTPDLFVVVLGFHYSKNHSPVKRSGWCLDMSTFKKHQRCHFDTNDVEVNCIVEATKPILQNDQ